MNRSQRTSTLRELVFNTLFFFLSIVALLEAFRITNENRYPTEFPGLFPMLIAPLMLLFTLITYYQIIRNRSRETMPHASIWELLKQSILEELPLDVVVMAAMGVLYVFLMSRIGYICSTLLFLIGSIAILGRKRIRIIKVLWISAACVGGIWLLFFKCFHVLLP